MITSFVSGGLAGYAIAIPVGAIAILIIDLGIRRGFRAAAAAGAGAAGADGLYAAVAVIGGTAIGHLLEPFQHPLRIVAIGALLGIGLRGLAAIWRGRDATGGNPRAPERMIGIFGRFLGLTLLNPATVIYFAALVLALPNLGNEPAERAAFAIGAFSASLSWQLTLAGIAAVAHRRLPPRFQVAVSLLGNLAICGFAILLLGDL